MKTKNDVLNYELGVLMFNVVNTIEVNNYDSYDNLKYILSSLDESLDKDKIFVGYNNEAKNHDGNEFRSFNIFNEMLRSEFGI